MQHVRAGDVPHGGPRTGDLARPIDPGQALTDDGIEPSSA